jgi:signal transduction histidine kinase
VDHLLKEAWRLRFSDSAREARFDESRLTSAKLRVRITIAVGLIVMSAVGLVGFQDPRVAPNEQLLAWAIRYLMCVPLWLLLFLSTWSSYFTQRMDRWLAPAIPVTCALFTWESITLAYLPEETRTPVLLGVNVLPLLMVSALAIPFRFRWLLSAVLLSVFLPASMVSFWQPNLKEIDLLFGVLNLSGFALCILVAGWWREAMERRLFAQREVMSETNAELGRMNEKLRNLNEEKSEFLALVAHDLRSPLSNIRSLAEVLALTPEPSKYERDDAVHEITETTDRMLEIVGNFLDFHAIEAGQLPLSLQPVSLNEIAKASRTQNLPAALRKSQRIELEVPSDPVWVTADRQLLVQIVDNLTSNALKFSQKNTIVKIRVGQVSAAEGQPSASFIEVVDNGPGFTEADLAHVFKKFTRLSARPTDGEFSTGLGLALVKRFAEVLQATIHISKTEPNGATIRLTLGNLKAA